MSESVMEWDSLRFLLAIETAGSLRSAAGACGVSQPTLGRRIRHLEHELGHPLLVRHARGVEFTDEGRAALEVARATAERIGDLQRGLRGQVGEVKGRVRLSCTEAVSIFLIPRALKAIREMHPELSVDVVVDNRPSDLDRREADIALRMFRPERVSLVARRLGSSFAALYASRDYLERRGRPNSPRDFRHHDLIGPDRDEVLVTLAKDLGFSLDAMAFRTDSLAATLAFVKAGVGIGALIRMATRDDPTLVQLGDPIVQYPAWLVTHSDLFSSAAVRTVWEALVEHVGPAFADPSLTPASHSPRS